LGSDEGRGNRNKRVRKGHRQEVSMPGKGRLDKSQALELTVKGEATSKARIWGRRKEVLTLKTAAKTGGIERERT